MGQRVVGLVVGGLLLLAATAKAHLYLVDPFAVEATLAAREFLWLAIQAEALIGLALVVGWQRVWTWRAAFVLFALFLIVNGWQIATAKPSCGCFGQVKVPPKLTLLLDATVLLALVGWWPNGTTGGRWLKGLAVAAGMVLLNVGLVGGERLLWSHVGTLDAPGVDGWVKLDVDGWAGRRFPLEDEIEEGYRLRFDRWLVVFHQRNCGNCAAVVKR